MSDNKNSTLTTKRVIREWVDEFGQRHRQIIEEVHENPLNLGSVMKPKHPELVHFAYNIPEEVEEIKNGV